jgi:uncharacterized protein YbjT (DUF2867 family)
MTAILILGATGAVGHQLLELALDDGEYDRVYTLGRRKTGVVHQKLKEFECHLDRLSSWAELDRVDQVFCTLGTTRKQAGSLQAFKKVDYDYVVAAGMLANRLQARCFAVISALGANAGSLFAYNRVKGEMENSLKALDLPHLLVFRPSLLSAERPESRLGEDLGNHILRLVNPLLCGPVKKYRSVAASQVAKAMLFFAREPEGAVQVLENDKILQVD